MGRKKIYTDEEIRQRRNEYNRRWRQKNPESQRRLYSEWIQRNPDYHHRWWAAHKDRINADRRAKYAADRMATAEVGAAGAE